MTRGITAVTGASGHLGQWVVARLTERGHDVLSVARCPRSTPTIDGVQWSRPVRTLACDLTDGAAVARARDALLEAEAVVHLAAVVPADTASNTDSDARATLRSNVAATIDLLRVLSESSRLRSLVYASTFEVYGPPSGLPIPEDHPTNPVTYYGASKLAGEQYVRLFAADRGVACCSLRMPAIYGPGETARRALGNFIRAAAAGGSLAIQGDGSDVRDLLYAADAAEAVATAIERQARGAYNLGSGRGYSIREMAREVCDVAGGSLSVARNRRVKPRVDYVLDIGRARADLGWAPRTAFEEGVRAQLAWVRGSASG